MAVDYDIYMELAREMIETGNAIWCKPLGEALGSWDERLKWIGRYTIMGVSKQSGFGGMYFWER